MVTKDTADQYLTANPNLAEILKGNMPKDKKIILPTVMVTKDTADQYLTANPNLAK